MLPGRWVRIMCDYSADGVWDRAGTSNDADCLPVTPELVERIRTWQESYEIIFDVDTGPGIEDLEAFCAEGRQIARAVKAALPDWTVVYHDEAALYHLPRSDRAQSRHLFEYEIAN